MKRRWVRIALLVLFAAAILVLSLLPASVISVSWLAGMDRAQHWVAYCLLGFMVYITIQARDVNALVFVAISVISCSVYGGLIEVLQSFVDRTPDVMDFLSNMAGSAVGSICALGVLEIGRDSRGRRNR